MAQVFKLRVKYSWGGVPKGFEFQHVDSHSYSTPTHSEVRETLIKLGFKDAKNYTWDGGKIEVLSRSK
jgi:hypothetical protein